MRNRGFKGEIRKEILQYCKSKGIGSDRFRPVPMDKWQNIYDEAVDHLWTRQRTGARDCTG